MKRRQRQKKQKAPDKSGALKGRKPYGQCADGPRTLSSTAV